MDTQATNIILPYQSQDTILLLADRYLRGTAGMAEWAADAKKCVDMTEGKQWSAEAIAALENKDRKAFTWNEIGSIVRLVLGYQRGSKTQLNVLPAWQGSATDDVAQALTRIIRQLAENSQEPYTDTEVFMDGMITGRGFYDARLAFEHNELGELDVRSSDPFSTILDPDGDEYDMNSLSYIIDERMVSIEEVEATYGPDAMSVLSPLVNSGSKGMPSTIAETVQRLAPWRGYGGHVNDPQQTLMESFYLQSYDTARKNLRLLDCQHHVPCRRKYWIDLETGRKEPVDDGWTPEQIQRVLQYSQAKYSAMGKTSPIRIVVRPGKRVRWTTVIGDIVVYDDWSKYESYTKVGFFPWFRRGKTRGMVSDLVEPQEAINKHGSAEMDIVARSANSGWQFHETSLTPEEEARLQIEGSTPGYIQKWKGDQRPTRIEPGQPPAILERLQLRNRDGLKSISGINGDAMGFIDKVQSGVAVEARQRQAVVGIQVYMDNFSRTRELLGRKKIEIIQNHYPEERTYRILGDDGKKMELTINERLATGEIRNDVTNGSYSLVVDETPLAKTFASAQFEEMKWFVETGILPKDVPEVRDRIIDASSLANKELLKKALSDFQEKQLQAIGTSDKKVSESLSYKDAPEDIRRQIEQQAGLQPSAVGGVAGQEPQAEPAVTPQPIGGIPS